MRIAITTWSLRIGGAEIFAVNLADALKRKGHTVCLLPMHEPHDREWLSALKKDNFEILLPFRNPALRFLVWKLNALYFTLTRTSLIEKFERAFLVREMRTFNPDIVVSNSPMTDGLMAEASMRVPYVVVEHGQYALAYAEGKQLPTQGLKNASAVVSVSSWCREQLRKHFGVDSHLIYTGHRHNERSGPVAQRPALPKDAFLFMMIGRGVEQKGWDLAIGAFLTLTQRHPHVYLFLIGSGPALDNLKDTFRHERLIYTGQILEPAEYLKSADVGLFPSRRAEAFGLSILDFFVHGKPVVASNLGGIPEVVTPNGNAGGLLINVDSSGEPSQDHLTILMETMVTNQQQRNLLARSAREIAEHFQFDRTATDYGKLLHELISK
jgi:L-malate glycosyltransferase